jgi:hypothetical protein
MANIETTTAIFLDDDGTLTAAQLVELRVFPPAELATLIARGALAPRDSQASPWTFSARCVVIARSARSLRDEFALDDAHAVAILLRFAQRIEELERALRAYRPR